jgi:Zn-dependent alcohol dehydrogenase
MGSNDFRTDMPHYIELDRQGRLDVASLIEAHIGLEDINDGYDAMRRREIQGRRVIMFPN